MAFERPTIEEIDRRVKGDLRTGLGLTAILRRSLEFAIGKAMTGLSHLLHGRASFISTQTFVDQMQDDLLDRRGAVYSFPRNAATFAQHDILITGVAGSTIPVNSEYTRNDGETYQTNAEVTIATAVAGVSEVSTITTVADVSGSLQSAYFEINTPTNNYYVWLNVNGIGIDPSLTDKTGIPVVIAVDDISDDVATAVQLAIDAKTDMNAIVVASLVTVTNVTEGSVTDIVDGFTATGFTLAVTIQGVDTVVGDQITATITADNAGTAPNTDVGETLQLSSAITGVDTSASITAIVIEGEDTESDDAYRERLLARIRLAPHGGNVNDYIQEAKKVTGVTRAWVTDGVQGAGSVGVSFVEDDEDDIFPGAAKIAEVLLQLDEFRPVTARVFVFSPVENAIDFEIQLTPNTAAVREAVEQELRDLIRRDANPKNAIKDQGTGETYTGTIFISRIREAVSRATGEENNVVVSPTADVTMTDGQMASVGTFSWQTL